MNVSHLDALATASFILAVLHTFLVSRFRKLATHFPEGSAGENFFHLLGEVEVSFGFWAAAFVTGLALTDGSNPAIAYLNSRSFTEPAFVFVIMAVCSTRPILEFAKAVISVIARLLSLLLLPIGQTVGRTIGRPTALYIATVTIGPLLGSLITEPAAMTVTALILLDQFFKQNLSIKFKYATIGLLFVSVSIGGTLTPYAAPPVLMVAKIWNWDLNFMLTHFAWRAILATVIFACLVATFFRRELAQVDLPESKSEGRQTPIWVYATHLGFLILIVAFHQHTVVFGGLFLLFLGLYSVTNEYQSELKLREGLLVAFFLAGVVVLGEPQRWWLEPLLKGLNTLALYLGAIGLTSIIDNAALAYLGSQLEGLSEALRYTLIAGSVVGGGLTVIANAPNPVGYGLLNSSFGDEGIKPLYLALAAAPFTAIAAVIFWL